MAIKGINSQFKISKKSIPIREFKSVVWMIFVGDGIHNFMDGVALGAAFSDPLGINGGISTSIAILLHELPHELSKFSMFLLSFKSFSNGFHNSYFFLCILICMCSFVCKLYVFLFVFFCDNLIKVCFGL